MHPARYRADTGRRYLLVLEGLLGDRDDHDTAAGGDGEFGTNLGTDAEASTEGGGFEGEEEAGVGEGQSNSDHRQRTQKTLAGYFGDGGPETHHLVVGLQDLTRLNFRMEIAVSLKTMAFPGSRRRTYELPDIF